MDKKYWEQYYKEVDSIISPSTFAQFCNDNYLKNNSIILEVGCGNGRDATYFAQMGYKTYATDQVDVAILNENNDLDNLRFFSGDVLENIDLPEEITCVYSRFAFHSMNADEEWRAINSTYDILSANGIFLIETRSIKSDLYGKGKLVDDDVYFYDNHTRRFINKDQLIEKLERVGFEIIESIEDNGLAVYKNDDPVIIRIIAKKN